MKYTSIVPPTVPVVQLNTSLITTLTLEVNVAVMVRSPVTVDGKVPHPSNEQPVSAVAVTSTASSHVPIVNTLSFTLIAVPYGTSVTLDSSTVQ